MNQTRDEDEGESAMEISPYCVAGEEDCGN
jgi:hypothetical protein